MKRFFTLVFTLILLSQISFAQVYVDEFDNDDAAFTGGAGSYTSSEADGEWTINASNTGPWDVFTYQMHDPSSGTVLVDATANNKIYVKAKASNVGTQLRMDLQDAGGYATSQAGITKTLTTEYQVLEFDFTDLYIDGGFGGTACNAGPCPVDGAQLEQLIFFTDPGIGGFNGTVVIDYIAFGEEPAGVIMSDVFQDHFDMDSSINAFIAIGAGYDLALNGESELVVTGDGSNPMWDPISYLFRNPTTLDTIDIDISGNNKFYIKVKSSVPGTALRVDVQDIDGFITTQGSITKIVGTDYSVIEYDFTGTYQDLGFGGTPCTMATAPCPVDPTRIGNITMFIEPGVGEFLGELTIDYISFDIPLEPAGPQADLVYSDHFNNETLDFTAEAPGLPVAETGSELIITGDGTAPQYSAVSYILHDKDLGTEIFLDMAPGQNKVFVKARAESGSVPLRIDLVDTTGYITNQAGLTKIISDEYETYEFDFSGNYFDGGFGGTPCDVGPCNVDPGAIKQVLIYVDPVAGAYAGTVYLDFVSIGQPAGEDAGPVGITNYNDEMDDNTALFTTDTPGLVSTFADDEWTITGDGTGGMWSPVVYALHNDLGEPQMANAQASEDKLFIRAKASVAGTEFRIDLQDNEGYVTNGSAVSTILSDEYVIYELNYTAYQDGGFGGTPCTAGPCDVDPERIAQMQFFINPGVGIYNGTITVDWISFGVPLGAGGPTGVINYKDEIDENTNLFITDEAGLVSTTNDIWTITGDGTGGMWSAIAYEMHDDVGELNMADAVGSNDKLYVYAKASSELDVRIDLQDNQGYITSLNAKNALISTEYEIHELDYVGAYQDGGFGGTPCTAGPCPVDGERIAGLLFYLLPGVGGFNGTLEIDWLAFGEPLVGVQNVELLNSLKAYPNPVADELNLALETLKAGEVEVIIFNAVGQAVAAENLGFQNAGKSVQTLNLANLPHGIYSLNVQIDGGYSGFLKFVKN